MSNWSQSSCNNNPTHWRSLRAPGVAWCRSRAPPCAGTRIARTLPYRAHLSWHLCSRELSYYKTQHGHGLRLYLSSRLATQPRIRLAKRHVKRHVSNSPTRAAPSRHLRLLTLALWYAQRLCWTVTSLLWLWNAMVRRCSRRRGRGTWSREEVALTSTARLGLEVGPRPTDTGITG